MGLYYKSATDATATRQRSGVTDRNGSLHHAAAWQIAALERDQASGRQHRRLTQADKVGQTDRIIEFGLARRVATTAHWPPRPRPSSRVSMAAMNCQAAQQGAQMVWQ